MTEAADAPRRRPHLPPRRRRHGRPCQPAARRRGCAPRARARGRGARPRNARRTRGAPRAAARLRAALRRQGALPAGAEPRRSGIPGEVPPRGRAGARAHPDPPCRRRRGLRRLRLCSRVRRRAPRTRPVHRARGERPAGSRERAGRPTGRRRRRRLRGHSAAAQPCGRDAAPPRDRLARPRRAPRGSGRALRPRPGQAHAPRLRRLARRAAAQRGLRGLLARRPGTPAGSCCTSPARIPICPIRAPQGTQSAATSTGWISRSRSRTSSCRAPAPRR